MKTRLLAVSALLLSATLAADIPEPDDCTEYAAQLHCLNQQFWDDPVKLDEAIGKLDPDDFDSIKVMGVRYDQGAEIQAAIDARARAICPW